MDRNRSALASLAISVRRSSGTNVSSERVKITSLPIRASINRPNRWATSKTRSFSRSPSGPIAAGVVSSMPRIEHDAPHLEPQHANHRPVAGRIALRGKSSLDGRAGGVLDRGRKRRARSQSGSRCRLAEIVASIRPTPTGQGRLVQRSTVALAFSDCQWRVADQAHASCGSHRQGRGGCCRGRRRELADARQASAQAIGAGASSVAVFSAALEWFPACLRRALVVR